MPFHSALVKAPLSLSCGLMIIFVLRVLTLFCTTSILRVIQVFWRNDSFVKGWRMSAIRDALLRLDEAIDRLEVTALSAAEERSVAADQPDNVVDVDFLAGRIDRAIASVELLLREEG